jgi:hypothetical protein
MIDYIKETEELIAQLRLYGRDSEAMRISDALCIGSTGTEIVMSLRWVINELLQGSTEIPIEIQKKMRNIVLQLAIFLDE